MDNQNNTTAPRPSKDGQIFKRGDKVLATVRAEPELATFRRYDDEGFAVIKIENVEEYGYCKGVRSIDPNLITKAEPAPEPAFDESKTAQTIRAGFTAKREAFVARYANHIENNFAALVKHCPDRESLSAERVNWAACRKSTAGVPSYVQNHYRAVALYLTGSGNYSLNDERVYKHAERYADQTIDALVAKVVAKVGDLDDVSVASEGGLAFTVRGIKCGRVVTVDQNVTVNVSKRGLVFNQYPARIYVDGDFVSAKAFAEITSEDPFTAACRKITERVFADKAKKAQDKIADVPTPEAMTDRQVLAFVVEFAAMHADGCGDSVKHYPKADAVLEAMASDALYAKRFTDRARQIMIDRVPPEPEPEPEPEPHHSSHASNMVLALEYQAKTGRLPSWAVTPDEDEADEPVATIAPVAEAIASAFRVDIEVATLAELERVQTVEGYSDKYIQIWDRLSNADRLTVIRDGYADPAFLSKRAFDNPTNENVTHLVEVHIKHGGPILPRDVEVIKTWFIKTAPTRYSLNSGFWLTDGESPRVERVDMEAGQ